MKTGLGECMYSVSPGTEFICLPKARQIAQVAAVLLEYWTHHQYLPLGQRRQAVQPLRRNYRLAHSAMG